MQRALIYILIMLITVSQKDYSNAAWIAKLIICDLLISYIALPNTVLLPFPIKVSLPLYNFPTY